MNAHLYPFVCVITSETQTEMQNETPTVMAHQKNKDLLDKLSYCLSACEHCADACLSEDEVSKLAECIRLDRDCADICELAIKYVSRDSRQVSAVLDLCAQICDACAGECEKHEHDHCKECAEACRECARACREPAAAAV